MFAHKWNMFAVEYIDYIFVEWWTPSSPVMSVQDMTLNHLMTRYHIILELWGKQSTLSFLLLSAPLWLGVLVPDRVLFMSQIELFDI